MPDETSHLLQQSDSSPSFQFISALESTKEMLRKSPNGETDLNLYGECYLISLGEENDLQWNKCPKSLVKPHFKVSADKITMDFMKKVYTSLVICS